MWNGLDKSQAGIKIARRNINIPRYIDDTYHSNDKVKSFLMTVTEKSEKAGLKQNIKGGKKKQQQQLRSLSVPLIHDK